MNFGISQSTVKDLSGAIGDVEARMRSELEAFEEHLQRTVKSQVELIFNRLDDVEVDSRLAMLERKVDVFAEELDDLIEERVAHFTKGERCFEAFDIDDEEEKVQTLVICRYIDECDVNTWEKFKHELKRQFYPKSIEDMAMINLRRLRQKGSIYKYMKQYLALMLKIPEMSESGLPQSCGEGNLTTWLPPWRLSTGRKTSSKVRGQDLQGTSVPKMGETVGRRVARPWQPMMSRVGTRDVTTIIKGKKKHEGSRKQGNSHDHKARGDPRGGCFYYAGPHYRRNCPHKGKIIASPDKPKGSNGDSSNSDGEA
ncbi:hypothetical protein RJ639_015698 [Escallonia herrerae]|uniref:Retrotransposon gag domain-containing protein n=1 Tax=Escallonia herrerae TaxID=1293975 RepID=A0AA88VD97_9ASTE|nr:hypothetical protein RJ639_015698 [Escallonia herrerae]